MDTSETYIKMCRMAKEIQPQDRGIRYHSPFKDGDMFVLGRKVTMYDECSHSEGFIEPEIYNPKCVWLPRQDQLQEMVGTSIWNMTLKFEYFLRSEKTYNITEYAFQFTSMEQLWLAFVMKEKYNKVWDGNKWAERL